MLLIKLYEPHTQGGLSIHNKIRALKCHFKNSSLFLPILSKTEGRLLCEVDGRGSGMGAVFGVLGREWMSKCQQQHQTLTGNVGLA